MVDINHYYDEESNLKDSIINLFTILKAAEEDVQNNRVAPISETFDNLRDALIKGTI